MIIETTMTMMAKPFIDGVVKEMIIPKMKAFCANLAEGVKIDYIPKTEHFQEYLFRSYKKYGIVNTLVQNNQQMELKDVYIPLTLKPINSEDRNKYVLIDGFPKVFFKDNHNILITDTAGMGKSTMTKRMFLDVIDSKLGIPIYIELRRLTRDHDLISEIIQQLNSLSKEVNRKLVLELFQTGNFVFFFDGYDEVPISELSYITSYIQDFVDKAGEENFYILTSRPDNALTCFGSFKSMNICALTRKQSYELLRKLDDNGETSSLLIEKLKSPDYRTIHEFLKKNVGGINLAHT